MAQEAEGLTNKIENGSWLSIMSHELRVKWFSKLTTRSILRVILGIVFVVSGAAKMWDIYGFSKIVSNYGVLSRLVGIPSGPESMIVPVTIIIPFAEFMLGGMLLVNYHVRAASLSLLIMVVMFTGFSAVKYFSGNVSGCGCFGKLAERKTNASLFVENAALVAALFPLAGSSTFTNLKTKKSEE